MNSQTTQTIAAVIQAFAAVVFLVTVVIEVVERRRQQRFREHERLVASLRNLWVQSNVAPGKVAMTHEELSGFYSQRQIDFINLKLGERGENWRYPFPRV